MLLQCLFNFPGDFQAFREYQQITHGKVDWRAAVGWGQCALTLKNISRFTCIKFKWEYRNFLGPCRPLGNAKLCQTCFRWVMFDCYVSQNKSFPYTLARQV